MTDGGPPLPDEVPLQVDDSIRLVAVKGATDGAGVVRYSMKFDTPEGRPFVQCSAVHYSRGAIGLIFDTAAGKIAIDFKLSERK